MATPLRTGANFQSKRQRKAARKALMRGWAPNAVADWRVKSRERAEFYRRLREMKMRRRKIATEMVVLASMVTGLRREVTRLGDRNEDVIDTRVLDETLGKVKTGEAAAATAADEFMLFSRRKIYFVEELAA
jgi:hypothetical protein